MAGKPIDITGRRYGKLTAIKLDHIEIVANGTVHYWLYKCDCGNEKVIRKGEVSQGGSRSCGCYLKESVRERNIKHGGTNTRLYKIYQGIKRRCLNPNFKNYALYGGRGIKMCEEWLNDFLNFKKWAENAGYQDDLSIERIDFNGNYEPKNCKWIPLNEQPKNTRRTVFITVNEEKHCMADWARILGISATNLVYKLKKNPNYISEIFNNNIANKAERNAIW